MRRLIGRRSSATLFRSRPGTFAHDHRERRCPSRDLVSQEPDPRPPARERPRERRGDLPAGGLPPRDVPRSPRRGRARREGPRRARPRHPQQDPGLSPRPGGGPPAAHAGRLLHRHEPGGPRRRQPARGERLQRAVQQHPQRRGAGHRGDHRPGTPARGPLARDARGPLAQAGALLLRGPRQDARHRRLRPHRHPGRRPRRGARHAGAVPRHRGEAVDGQQPAGRLPAGRCWRRPTSSPCTSRRRPSRAA